MHSCWLIVYFNLFFVLNLGSRFDLLSSKTFFFIFHHCYYANLNSAIICCLFSRDIYLSFGASTLASSFPEQFFEFNFFEALVILSALLLLIKSPLLMLFFELLYWKYKKKPLCNLKCSILIGKQSNINENRRNYNIKLPRIFVLSLLIVSPLHKDPQTI